MPPHHKLDESVAARLGNRLRELRLATLLLADVLEEPVTPTVDLSVSAERPGAGAPRARRRN